MTSTRPAISLLAVAAVLLPTAGCKDPGEEIPTRYNSARYSSTPDGINSEIATRGAEIVAFEIHQNPDEWRDLLDAVAQGSPEWLKAAVALNDGTSGNATDELTTAVRRALASEPENVLQLTARSWCIRCLCDAPDTRDPRYAAYRLAEAELERRIAAVRTVEEKSLQVPRNTCLAELELGRGKLKRVFGR